MDISRAIQIVSNETAEVLEQIDPSQVALLVDQIQAAPRVFLSGEGRSGLVARMFAMRLMHLGHHVHVVSETTTPAIGESDLLIICSGSGATAISVYLAESAKRAGAVVAAVTAAPASPLFAIAHLTVAIPTQHKHGRAGVATEQYGGSLFEQAALLVLDALVLQLQSVGVGHGTMDSKHTNLE